MDSPRAVSMRRVVILLGCLGLLGGGLLLVATPHGLGANVDGATYILAARSVLSGDGLRSFASIGPIDQRTEPLVYWPPFLPLVLAGIGLTGVDPQVSVQFLNALLFALNIGLAGWLVWRISGSVLATVVAALMVLGAPHILVLHAMAWSEPIFLALTLTAILMLARYLTGGPGWLLPGMALVVAAAIMTRYVGMAFILVGGLALLIWPGRSFRRRFLDPIVLAVPSIAALGAWMLRNQGLMGTTSGRRLAFHPPLLSDIRSLGYALLTWLFPRDWVAGPWPLLLAGLGVALLALGLALWITRRAWWPARFDWRRFFQPPEAFATALVLVSSGFVLVYMVATLGSMTFFDDFIVLGNRILSPVYIFGMIVAVGLTGRGLARLAQPALRWPLRVANVALVLLGLSYGLQGADWIARNRASGENLGVGADAWRESPLLELIDDLPPGTPLATNRQDALYVVANRLTYRLPIPYNPVTAQTNPLFEAEMEILGELFAAENGVVIYFLPEDQVYVPTVEQLEASWPICRTETAADGLLYYLCEAHG